MQNRRPHWPSRLPFYYGWVIVGAAFVTMAVGVTARTAFSLLMPPLIDEFHWDRGVAAGAFSFGFLVSALLSPIVGWMIDLRGPRIIIMCGVMLTAAGLHVLMQAASTGRPIAWGLPSTCSIWLLPTQESGINSARRSPITRVFNGCSLTWLQTCTQLGSSVTRLRGDTIGSRNTVQALLRWPNS